MEAANTVLFAAAGIGAVATMSSILFLARRAR
jgi:hypothetical protein